ncbi:hypothetical protein N7539_003069 [Penicillium diatomitis]|uniref:Uncharacterized protein n=1 Tax=Penicillium diatomitis TaxID=2819901 RepID=A0A9X0BZS8_9EURO|nr:uncharacterized protein N7539_003069 [Penicillium diatomitis]KAJ5491502.1 hypothetical protein N7539_003069 [Penicillium diatomitis]
MANQSAQDFIVKNGGPPRLSEARLVGGAEIDRRRNAPKSGTSFPVENGDARERPESAKTAMGFLGARSITTGKEYLRPQGSGHQVTATYRFNDALKLMLANSAAACDRARLWLRRKSGLQTLRAI